MRVFKVTLPADTNNHNLFSLLVGTANYGLVNGGTNETGITGAIPTNGILPDRVSFLILTADSGNSGTIAINDGNYANTTGTVLAKNITYSQTNTKNSICLKDFFIAGSADSQAFELNIDWN